MAEIMELLEQRDARALELLKETYGKCCYSIIYGLLRSHEETEEVLNDVWPRIWSSIPPARLQCCDEPHETKRCTKAQLYHASAGRAGRTSAGSRL